MTDAIAASTILNADNELKRLANQARNIIALEEQVSRFGTLTQAIAETERRLEAVRADEAAARDAVAAARAEAVGLVDAARGFIEQRERDASASTDALVEASVRAANDLRASAEGQIAKLRADTESELTTLRSEIAGATAERDGVVAAIEARRAELAELEAAIADRNVEHERVRGEHEALLRRIGAR